MALPTGGYESEFVEPIQSISLVPYYLVSSATIGHIGEYEDSREEWTNIYHDDIIFPLKFESRSSLHVT